MPVFKRKFSYRTKKTFKTNKRTKYATKKKVSKKFAKAVMSVVKQRAETKEVFRSLVVNGACRHNNIQVITDNAFYTEVGTRGEDLGNTSATGTRIGKTTFIKGLKVALMLENLQKRPQVTYWLYLIKNKQYPDVAISEPSMMFEGKSTTLPMDFIDQDRVHILFCKKFVVKMPNIGTSKDMPSNATNTGSGMAPVAETDGISKAVVTNPQIITKFWVPIHKTIEFRDDHAGSTRTFPIAPHRYQWLLVIYNNYSTTSDVNLADSHVGSIHMTQTLYHTDP